MVIQPRRVVDTSEQIGGSFAGAFALHGLFAATLFGWAFFLHGGQNWGSAEATAGAIQATMVNALPLPSKQPVNEDNVLATDTPTPAPIEAKAATVETPRPDAIPIPVKPTKPVKTAEKNTPPPPLHPQPMKPELNKAPAGEAPGLRVAMSTTQTRVGTVSVGVTDAGFGARFAYYRDQITQKVAKQWYTGMLDSNAQGHRVYISFEVERDGSVSQIQIAQPSGDATLDQTALAAVRHIDTFGPLPDGYTGSHINVTYYFDPPVVP